MTRLRKASLLIAFLTLLSLITAFAARRQKAQQATPALGIEIATSNGLLFLPASSTHKVTVTHIMVPTGAGGGSPGERVSALRIMPRMEGDKVRVTVYAVYGDASAAKSCSDWKALRASVLTSHIAGNGEAVTLNELTNLGVKLSEGALTFRVVPNKNVPASPSTPTSAATAAATDDCICALCNGMGCCAGSGECVRCNHCGPVCCFPVS